MSWGWGRQKRQPGGGKNKSSEKKLEEENIRVRKGTRASKKETCVTICIPSLSFSLSFLLLFLFCFVRFLQLKFQSNKQCQENKNHILDLSYFQYPMFVMKK